MKKVSKVLAASAMAGAATSLLYYGFVRKLVQEVFQSRMYDVDLNEIDKDYENTQQWFETVNAQEMWITGVNNVQLYGAKIINHPKSDKWVILSHGYSVEHHAMLKSARAFDAEGYNCLLIDHRFFGKSEGSFTSFGYYESDDLVLWINKLVSEYNDAKIVLCGISMGASVVMLALGKGPLSNVVCAVEDCGYNSVEDQLAYQFKVKYKMPFKTIKPLLKCMVYRKFKIDLDEISCVKALEHNETPIMFIHGEEDVFVPFEMVFINYYANKGIKELYAVAGAGHARSSENPEYFARIFRFANRFM